MFFFPNGTRSRAENRYTVSQLTHLCMLVSKGVIIPTALFNSLLEILSSALNGFLYALKACFLNLELP